jgi:hypothetical protein
VGSFELQERGLVPFVLVLSITLLIVITLVSITTVATTDRGDVDLPRHSIDISVRPDALTAKISKTQLGAVSFWGNCSIEKPQGVERVTVTLSASMDTGWPVVISPQTMVYINPQTQSFCVTVIVPPKTSSTLVGNLTTLGQAKSPIWEGEDTATAKVYVSQYFKMEINATEFEYDAEPGETVYGDLLILNDGNGPDTFTIALGSNVPKELTVTFDEVVNVPMGLEVEVEFEITIDEDFKVDFEGSYIGISFQVTSQKAREKNLLYTKSLRVTVHMEGLQENLYLNWPTYVGVGVGSAFLIAIPVIFFRRRKRARIESESLLTEDILPSDE